MPGFLDAEEDGDRTSLLSAKSVKPSPDALTKLIKRLRALTLTLLPVEVDPESIKEPTSRIITPQVISAYRAAAGDFVEALPYCLLRAKAKFIFDANHNPADYGENRGRAIACEVLARRIVHLSPPDRIHTILSSRFQHREVDGEESDMASALEVAIDTHCTIFLSSSEAQDVVTSLWTGRLVQVNNANHDIDYVPYGETRETTFWNHLEPARLGVPRYQNIFRIVIWLSFLVVYSQAVREPLERLGTPQRSFDIWEIILYTMALAFTIEDAHRLYSLLRFSTWRAFSFWNAVAFFTDSLLVTAFVLRVLSITGPSDDDTTMQLRSFQALSLVSPLIWMKLITIFDGYKYMGTMQLCVARMLKESGIFFALLSVLAIGFFQGLFALDAADGATEDPSVVVHDLIQALLQAPNYEKYSASTPGLLLYYLWTAVTAIILLNVLISLFASAYSEVVDDAEAQYLAFFAGKTIGMIRAPDSYVYPAPFNLIEIFIVAPFEILPLLRIDGKAYAQLNRYVMITVFFIPLSMIALYETTFARHEHARMRVWLRGDDQGEADYPETRDPDVDEDGLKISKVPFAELIKVFPDTQQSTEANIIKEVKAVGQAAQSSVMNTQSTIIKETQDVGRSTVSAVIQEMQTMKQEIRDLQERLANAITREQM
ncbi:putative calcium activated cation channel [Lyophyllum shimeji]|uniref:Calcium activated cation channel n=1 Tax=Lyophyllum shimeji TaxID=47721 RepID=A0A9P3PEC9_LYOSH|nr:putative calcium activated cation channel [Lyophyllum shimeji]